MNIRLALSFMKKSFSTNKKIVMAGGLGLVFAIVPLFWYGPANLFDFIIIKALGSTILERVANPAAERLGNRGDSGSLIMLEWIAKSTDSSVSVKACRGIEKYQEKYGSSETLVKVLFNILHDDNYPYRTTVIHTICQKNDHGEPINGKKLCLDLIANLNEEEQDYARWALDYPEWCKKVSGTP